ncbi:MAG: hypothetical protein LIP00_03545 [Parabacteroides sp.]|nr:hypothetical protein [Parabacteroides sp.]
MKKKYYFMAVATLMLGACSEDTVVDRGGGDSSLPAVNSRTEIKFTLGGIGGGVVPYAPVATEAENELKTLDVFVFNRDTLPDGTPKADADGKVNYHLEEVFKFGEGGTAITDDGSKKTASITVNGHNLKYFFFVANARDVASMTMYELNKTDTAEFFSKLTDRLNTRLVCPLIMSANRQFNLKDSIDNSKTGPYTIDLKRIVARFDINNVAKDSKFYIHTVKIQNARTQSFIFPQDTLYMPAEGLVTLAGIDYRVLDNANLGMTRSAFYMYPSPIADNASLVLEGARNADGTDPVDYAIKFQKVQDLNKANDVDIQANYYYVLNLEAVGMNEIGGTLQAIKWGDNDTINIDGGLGSLALALDANEARAGVSLAKNVLTLPAEVFAGANPGDTDPVKISILADSEWELDAATVPDWLEATLTDDADGVARTLTVKALTANTNGDGPRKAVVVLKNVLRPSITQTLVVEQSVNPDNYIKLQADNFDNGVLSVAGIQPDAPDGVRTVRMTVTTAASAAGLTGSWSADVTNLDGTALATPWIVLSKEAAPVSYAAVDNGASGELLVLTIQPSEELVARSAMVTLQLSADYKRTFVVTQDKQNLGDIILSGIDVDPATGNGTLAVAGNGTSAEGVRVGVKAATAWEVVVPAEATWITVPDFKVSALKDKAFYIVAAKNETGSERTAVLSVQNTIDPSIKQEITVTQGIPVSLTLGSETVTEEAAAIETAKTISVTTNADAWEVTGDAAADRLTVAKNADGDAIEYTMTENTGFANRTATVTVTAGDVTKAIAVTQKGIVLTWAVKEGSDDTGTEVSGAVTGKISQDGATGVDVYVATNGGWTATSDAAWVSLSAASGDAAGAITLTATEANADAADRTANVTITSTVDDTKTVTFTVTQEGNGAGI